jgi:hypothetical protein
MIKVKKDEKEPLEVALTKQHDRPFLYLLTTLYWFHKFLVFFILQYF